MKWKKVEGSGGIDDRRGQAGAGGGRLPGGMPPLGKAGGGAGMLLLLVVVVLFALSRCGAGDGSSGLSPGLDAGPTAEPSTAPPEGDTATDFTKFVNKDVQDLWQQIFADSNKTYNRAGVVIFSSGTVSACGNASSSTGPFYCPADHKVYLDLSFFNALARRFGAPGDFAVAYVIAHELGHHVQTELGIEGQMRELVREDPSRENELSVALELQADCFAGVWAQSTYQRGMLEEGDLEEGLDAAEAVGDDRLGARSPEQWTHGSSELRKKWFAEGFNTGDPGACDTFAGV
jgi:uncharacterized protein